MLLSSQFALRFLRFHDLSTVPLIVVAAPTEAPTPMPWYEPTSAGGSGGGGGGFSCDVGYIDQTSDGPCTNSEITACADPSETKCFKAEVVEYTDEYIYDNDDYFSSGAIILASSRVCDAGEQVHSGRATQNF